MTKQLPPLSAQDVERFWAKVQKGADGVCWLWSGALLKERTGKTSYGLFRLGRGLFRAHRIAFELVNGPLNGLLARHTCDNPPCCNPAHLLPGTVQDNAQDAQARGRMRVPHPRSVAYGSSRGERHPQAKLTEEKVIALRRRAKEPGANVSALAREFGVSNRTVQFVRDGVRWAHVGAA